MSKSRTTSLTKIQPTIHNIGKYAINKRGHDRRRYNEQKWSPVQCSNGWWRKWDEPSWFHSKKWCAVCTSSGVFTFVIMLFTMDYLNIVQTKKIWRDYSIFGVANEYSIKQLHNFDFERMWPTMWMWMLYGIAEYNIYRTDGHKVWPVGSWTLHWMSWCHVLKLKGFDI